MSILIRAALVCLLVGAARPGVAAETPAAQPAAPANTTGAAAGQPSAAPEGAADPVVQAVREEVERLRKTASEAEAAASDEAGRTRVRLQLITDLLLVLIRQQEQLTIQNQALLAMVGSGKPTGSGAASGTSGSATPAVKASSPSGKPAGVLFGKRGGGGKVHRPGCLFGERIAVGSRVRFSSLAQAAAAGLPPCKVCRPDR